ncbi:AlbA family DNA-binding domain-containing protein [Deinococcus sp. UYEF24]
MRYEDFISLLDYGESEWLDYKAELHAGIEQREKKNNPDLWEAGKATLLKDLMCLANSPSPMRTRYLVRGVKELNGKRTLVGVSCSLDDADLQVWAHDRFDPPLEFLYTQWPLETDPEQYVGVFQVVPSARGPIVPKRDLAKVVARGQVWWRTGSGNAVAGRAGLARLFGPPEPSPIVTWHLSDGTLTQTAWTAPLSRLLADIDQAFPEKLRVALTALQDAVAAFDPDAEWTPKRNPLNNALTEKLVLFSQVKVDELQRDLQQWNFEIPDELLRPQGVYTDFVIDWPRLQDVFLTVDGPGHAWYKALRSVLSAFEVRQGEQQRAREGVLQIRFPMHLRNLGRGALPETTIRFIALENLRFASPKVSALQRLSSWLSPRPPHEDRLRTVSAEPLPAAAAFLSARFISSGMMSGSGAACATRSLALGSPR